PRRHHGCREFNVPPAAAAGERYRSSAPLAPFTRCPPPPRPPPCAAPSPPASALTAADSPPLTTGPPAPRRGLPGPAPPALPPLAGACGSSLAGRPLVGAARSSDSPSSAGPQPSTPSPADHSLAGEPKGLRAT